MFLFLPIIGIIFVIIFALAFQGNVAEPYANIKLALVYIFLVGPFAVSFLSYFIQYLISINKGSNQWLAKVSNLPPYLVFLIFIIPQLSQESTGSWLYTALDSLTAHFSWLHDFMDKGAIAHNAIQLIKQILLITQYFLVFTVYMVASERFKSLAAKRYYINLPVGFLSNNRMLIFGYFFVLLLVSFGFLASISDTMLASIALSFSPDHSFLIIQTITTISRIAFPVLFLMFFPLILPVIAGWKPLEDGPTLELIKEVSKRNNFTYHKIYLAGKPGLLTAGIIGVFPWTRNLMFTADIIELLDEKEQESVLLHEIGHAKYYHIFTYLLFIMSFSLVVEILTASSPTLSVMEKSSNLVYLVSLGAMFGAFIYFGWGWLSRQCERQADLNAAEVQGTPEFIISSFKKLSDNYGGILDSPSWHHGSLGARINNLEKAYEDEGQQRKSFHHKLKKIKMSIGFAFLLMVIIFPFINKNSLENKSLQIFIKDTYAMNQFKTSNFQGCVETYKELLSKLNEFELKESEKSNPSLRAHYNMACAYSKMKDANSAYNSLNKVLPFLTPIIMKYQLSVKKFSTDPDFAYIRDSEWFQAYMKKIKKIKKAFDDNKTNPFLKS
ncbi:MAG: hypothetical protein COA79_08810 [Planctomycetota bacterium]|nr:MAG: hypothetical protein COA79_08810 [Planctomycetota bacterium]